MDDATQKEYAPQRVEVRAAESWMDRPIKVSLVTDAPRGSNSNTFYLDEPEAHALAAALEAAQRPPVELAKSPEDIAAEYAPFDGSDPDTVIHVRGLIAAAIREDRAQRPPVSPEAREELATTKVPIIYPGGTRMVDLGYPVADALLARFSFPQRPSVSPEVQEVLAVVESALAFWNNGHGHHDAAWVSRMAYNMGDALQRAATALRLVARFSFPSHPEVSPEAREELEWAGIKALVESAEVPTGVRGLLLGEVFTIREAVDAEVVVRVILDALLARFSVPSQPVYDEEKIAKWLCSQSCARVDGSCWRVGTSAERDEHRADAAALVAALRGGELTREETNE